MMHSFNPTVATTAHLRHHQAAWLPAGPSVGPRTPRAHLTARPLRHQAVAWVPSDRKAIHRLRCQPARSMPEYTPFPYVETEYHQIKLLGKPYGPIMAHDPDRGQFVLTFQRNDDESPPAESTPCLEVVVQGDTAKSLCLKMAGQRPERPVAIDLLWQVLQRGMAISKKDWKLLRVAVVGVTDHAYVGRLFFGDAETGTVVWDCDCRPSDACWLALSVDAPILVKRSVWMDHAVQLRETAAYKMEQEQHRTVEVMASKPAGGQWKPRPRGRGAVGTSDIDVEDPEEIKLLKREMEVAVKEEDYGKAAALREHPYMRLYVEMRRMYLEGADEHAATLQDRLMDMIRQNQRFGSDRVA